MKSESVSLQGGVTWVKSSFANRNAVLAGDQAGNMAIWVVCLFMAFAPVLDPYVIPIASADVRANDLLVLLVVAYLLLSKNCAWDKKGLSLVVLSTTFLFCTLLSILEDVVGRDVGVALKIAFVYLAYACFYGTISGRIVLDRFAKVATWVAIAATVLLFLQYLQPSSMWDGRLPLALSESDQFMPLIDPTTGEVRPHGFFQEVSYYALYAAPVLIYAIMGKRFVISAFLSIGLLFSSSFLGFVTLGIAFGYAASKVRNAAGNVDWRKVTLVVSAVFFLILIVSFLIALDAVPFLNSVADLVARRASSILDINATYNWGRSSAQLRLLGNINLFSGYDSFQKLFGLGVGEYANVFSGVETTYGSSMVNMLLGFGSVGAIALVAWSLYLIKMAKRGMRVFPVLVILALFTDNVLFGWYFFYLLSWVDFDSSIHQAMLRPLVATKHSEQEFTHRP